MIQPPHRKPRPQKPRRYQTEDDAFRDPDNCWDAVTRMEDEYELPDWLVGGS